MRKSRLLSLLVAGLLSTVGAGAFAAQCGGTAAEPLNTSDVRFDGPTTALHDATNCAGPIGGNPNDVGSYNTALTGSNVGAGWVAHGGTDSNLSFDVGGLRITISMPTGAGTTTGSFTVTVTDIAGLPDLPASMDFLVVLKAGNQFAAYLFEDEQFLVSPNNGGTGTWTVMFDNDPNSPPFAAISHLDVLVRDIRDECCDQNEVPEPGSLALIGLGLLGLGLARRARRIR